MYVVMYSKQNKQQQQQKIKRTTKAMLFATDGHR